MKAQFSGIVMLSLLFTISGHAQTSGARFLCLRPSAVSNAMGGIGVATTEDAFATYFNPAGLAFSHGFNFGASFVKPLPFFGGIVHGYTAASYNDPTIGAFAVSGNFYSRGKQQRTNSSGVAETALDNFLNYNVKLSFARQAISNVSVGLSIGLLQQRLSDRGAGIERGNGKSTSVLFDIGVCANELATSATWDEDIEQSPNGIEMFARERWHRGVSFGLSFLNIGPQVSFIDPSQKDPLPTCMLLGVAYSPMRLRQAGFIFSVEAEKRFNDESLPATANTTLPGQKFLDFDYVHFGGELSVYRLVVVQLGRYEDTRGPENSFWTWGFGITTRFFSLQAAHYTQAIEATWHFDGQFHWEL